MTKRKNLDAAQPENKRFKKGDVVGRHKDDPIRIVSCKLNTIFKPNLPKNERKVFQDLLNNTVLLCARLTHEATILSNMVVEHCMRTGDDVGKIDQLFFQLCMAGVRNAKDSKYIRDKISNPAIQKTVQTLWTSSDVDYSAYAGLSGFNAPIARELATNAKNHLVENFYDRQLHVLGIQYTAKSEDHDKILRGMQNSINALTYNGSDPIVLEHRAKIGEIHDLLNHKWLKNVMNMGTILRYYHYLGMVETQLSLSNQAYHDLMGEAPNDFKKAKTFTYLPIRGYSRHCLPIEANGISCLLRKAGLFRSVATSEVSAIQVELYSRVFNLEKFATNKLRPGYRLSTDGVRANVEYFIKGGTPANDRSKRKVHLSKETRGLYAMDQVEPEQLSDVVGCDPGRHSLLTLYDADSGQFFNYSKREHYENAGFLRATSIRNRWLQELNEHEKKCIALCNEQSFKICHVPISEAWSERVKIEQTLWKIYGHTQYRNLRFDTYGRKQRAYAELRNHIQGWVGRDRSPVIAFGAAKFKTTAKGDVSGPLKEMATKLAEQFRVVYTSEFRSSVCCHTCGCRMKNPRRKGGVRGTVFCIFRCDQCKRFRNRDRNASRNIRESLLCHMFGVDVRYNFRRSTKKDHLRVNPEAPLSLSLEVDDESVYADRNILA